MEDLELYNKFLDKKIFEIKNPMGTHLPGFPAKVKMKLLGEREYIVGGNRLNFITYEIMVLPTGQINKFIDMILSGKKHKELTTTNTELYELRHACNEKLNSFLSLMGEDTPSVAIAITNEYTENMNESMKEILTEDVYDKITNKVVHDIINLVRYQRDGDFELPSDISDDEFYHFDELLNDFSVDVFLRQSDDVETFDADANYYRDDDVIEVIITTNPNSKNTILQDLVYELNELVRHELEHVKQHESGYDFPKSPKSSHKYYGQSHELEALQSGFRKKAKKTKRDMEDVVRDWFEKNKHKYTMTPKQTENIIRLILQKSPNGRNS